MRILACIVVNGTDESYTAPAIEALKDLLNLNHPDINYTIAAPIRINDGRWRIDAMTNDTNETIH